jgi:uncharacterized membrane protein YkvA (DUF1232 family)
MTESERNNQEEEQMEALESSTGGTVRDSGFWKEFWYQVRLVWYLLRDPEVPMYIKVVPLIALIYVLIPTDLIPDVFPVMGQLDDITALLVGGKVFIEMAPNHVVKKYLDALHAHTAVGSVDDGTDDNTSVEIEDAIVIEGDFEAIEDEQEDRAD